jgi:hypothetical protein
MRHSLLLLTLAALAFGQTSEVKDRHGVRLVTISNVKMFRYSSKLDQNIPFLQGVLTNVSGAALNVALIGTLHKKDGSVETFPIGIAIDNTFLPCTVPNPCEFEKDSPREIVYPFPQPWFAEGDVQSVEFAFPDSWQSPEDRWIADKVKEQAEKDAAAAEARHAAAAEAQADKDAARRKRLAAERKKKQAELDAQHAREEVEREERAADERRKVRAACALIYRNTADTKLRDLTVKEEQQVRACQALGLYPPQ